MTHRIPITLSLILWILNMNLRPDEFFHFSEKFQFTVNKMIRSELDKKMSVLVFPIQRRGKSIKGVFLIVRRCVVLSKEI